MSLSRLVEHEVGYACIDAVCRDLDAAVARGLEEGVTLEGVYCYEDAAVETFRVARDRGIHRIYDLPIGYWRAARDVFAEEAERLPDWRATMPGLKDSQPKLDRKDEELSLANRVIVASTFTAKTLSRVPFPIVNPTIIPYGCDEVETAETREGEPLRVRSKPLRVLFVGSLTQRKGLYEVFKAVSYMKDRARLTVVGRRVGESPERDRQLASSRWVETAPKSEVLRLMREHDALVFPSLFEGFGLVITEALSQGLPVITTANTAGPDVLTEGKDGFIVPIRDWESIALKLEALDRDREMLAEMKRCARAQAVTLTWTMYQQHLVRTVKEVIGKPCALS
ncbi:glycosyltransferase family 4 protein [Verrucomicrobiota bacterium sgz303538]